MSPGAPFLRGRHMEVQDKSAKGTECLRDQWCQIPQEPHTPMAVREGGGAGEGLTHRIPLPLLWPPSSQSPPASSPPVTPGCLFGKSQTNPSLLCGSVLGSHFAHFIFRGRALLHKSPASRSKQAAACKEPYPSPAASSGLHIRREELTHALEGAKLPKHPTLGVGGWGIPL